MNTMTTRYRLTYYGHRRGMFYCVDKTTGKRTSPLTTEKIKAQQIIEAKNQAERQPVLNLQIAHATSPPATRLEHNAIGRRSPIASQRTPRNQLGIVNGIHQAVS